MRIARIVEYLPPCPGGKEIHAFELTRALSSLGVDHVVFFGDGNVPCGVQGLRIRSRVSLRGRTQLAAFCLGAAHALREQHRRAPFDAIHAHGDFPEALAMARVAGDLHVPAFLSVHGGLSKVSWHNRMRTMSFSAMERVFAVSPRVAEEIVALGVSSEIVVRPSGVRDAFFHARGAAREPNHLVVVGRLARVKGLETVLAAHDELAGDAVPVRWTVVGDGTGRYADWIRRELMTRPGIEVRAERDPDRLASLVATAGALVLPSDSLTGQREGMPTAALEAIAAGTPIIASDSAGLEHLPQSAPFIHFFRTGDATGLAHAVRNRATLVAPNQPVPWVESWPAVAASVRENYRTGIARARRTSVFFAVPWLEVGGAEHIMLSLAQAAGAAGYRTFVSGAPGSLSDSVTSPLELVPTTWNSTRKSFVDNTLRLAGAFARSRPVAVNTHHFLLGVCARVASAVSRVPTRHVLTVHVPELRRNEAVIGALAPLLFESVLPVADVVRDDLIRFTLPPWRRRVHVVRAGVEPPLEMQRRRVIGVVARLVKRKGHTVLIEAWEKIVSRAGVDGWSIEIVGEGPERPGLEREIRRRGLESTITMRGTVPAAGSVLPEFEIVVLPSLREGLPLVLIEAMAAGCAVVATSLPGCRELAGDGAARLVAPNDPDSLADALEEMIFDPAARRAVAAAGRERYRARYSRERMLVEYGRELCVPLVGRERTRATVLSVPGES